MEWIFGILGVGSLGLLTAQLVDYVVEAKRARTAQLHFHASAFDVPPGDGLPSAEITTWYDKAA